MVPHERVGFGGETSFSKENVVFFFFFFFL